MLKKVHIAAISYATIFGFTFMFSKVALNYVLPIGLIAYRFLIAFLVLEALRWFKIIHISFKKEGFKKLLLVALLQPILYFLFETYGLRLTTSGEAGMMIALIPIFVTVFSAIMLKERAKKAQIAFILLSVSGVVLIQIMNSSSTVGSSLFGFLLLLGAVISAALFNIASRSASKSLKPVEITYFMMFGGAVVFNLMYVILLVSESRPLDYFTNFTHIDLLIPILYLGVIASIGGFFLVNFALSKIPAHISSIYANLSTVVAIIAGVVILKENLEIYHFIGGAMIIIGVYGTVRLGVGKKAKVKLNHG